MSPQGQPPEEPRVAKSATERVWDLVGCNTVVALGSNLPQELFRFAAFATSMLVFALQEEETLSWDEFKLCYDSVLRGRFGSPVAGQLLSSPRRRMPDPLRGILSKM
jgi:hypothetical protein